MNRAVLLLPLLAVQVQVPRAWACSCAQTTPVEAAEAAGSAYVAEVVGVGLGGCSATNSSTVRVEVVDAIVGIEEGESVERDVNVSDSASCGMDYPFEVGDRWIFYGAGELNLCSPDQPYDEGVVAELKEWFGT